MKKRLASIALALTLSIGMMPTAAWAEDDGISVQNNATIAAKDETISAYWILGTENNGDVIKRERTTTADYIITADKTKTVWDKNAYYFVEGNVTITGDVTVDESVFLCLCDNATLTINGSVKINRSRGQLRIMGQSTGTVAGQMIVNNPDGNAFECLDSTSGTASGTADIFMYSGRLTATGKDRALGENVYLYKAGSTNLTPILCVADGQKVRATASKTNPDEPHWSSNKGQSAFSAKSFTLQWCNHENEEWEYVKVDDTSHYKVREWCNWHDGGAAGAESHNQKTKPTADGKGHSGKCLCGYGSGAVEAHTWDTDGITCTVCNFKKAASTSNGNLYDDVNKALAAEPAGGTVTLEADVTAPITISSAVTLDLNGKNVTSLTVNDPAAKIKDSGKTKGTIAKLTAGKGVTLGSLCEDGYGWKSADDNKWVAESAATASNVQMAEAPIKSVTINGKTAGLVVTKTYGESGVVLTGNIVYGSGSGTAAQKWYQVNNNTATEIPDAGSLAYELPRFLDAVTHIYRLTVTIDGYSKSCDATVIVNPADIKGAQIVVKNEDDLVFTPGADGNGTSLTANITVNKFSKPLEEGTDYIVSGDEATNAGTHTLTISGIGNYTGTETAEWEIQPDTVTVPTIPNIIKTYDGTTDLPADFKLDSFKSESTGNTVSLTAGKDYTMTTARYSDADVGKEKTVRLTLTMRNPNYLFEGRKTIRDLIVDKTFYSNTQVVINQAAMPAFSNTMSLNVVNNQEDRYQIKLPALPQPPGTCNYGGITYKITGNTLDSRYYTEGASIDANGVLTLPIQAVAADTEGSIGTIRVLVRTRNYQDAVLTVNVSAVNKIVPQKQSIDVSTITYGEPLSKADFTAFTFVEPGTSTTVAGTLAWKEPDKRLEAGTQAADWVFTPADGAKYAGATGQVNVTVDPAKVTGAPKYIAITQSGKTVSDAALTVEGGTFSRTGSVKWVDNAGNALPADTEVKQGTAYKWLFTPADTKNYHTLSGEIVLWAAASNGGSGGSSSGGGSSASAEGSAVVTVENKAGASTEVITKTTVKDAKTETTKNAQGQDVARTTAVVSEKIAEQLVDQAVKNQSDTIEITVSSDGKNSDAAADSVKSTELTLPKSAVTSIAKDTDADLVIRTGHGEVVLDNKTLQTMASKAGGDAVQIVVSENTRLTDAQKSAADVIGSNGRLFDLAAKIGDSQLHDFKGGKAYITLPIPKALKGKEICVVYINDEGLCEIINHSMEIIGGDSYVKFTASHFSTFAVVENTAAQDQAQWKARLNQAGFQAVTAKTEKKNVRIRLAVKKDKKLIAELEAMGYTVKYRFYRSQKKSTGYKALATKKSNTFVSTKGTKGKKYYYKVKVLVYDNDKLLAQTKLGQCSAGAKKWKK